MPYFQTSEIYLQQSLLLLQARPETTRITTKYTSRPRRPSRRKLRDPRNPEASSSSTSAPPAPIAASTEARKPKIETYLVLKTYDPVSGVCLKYKTDKGAEVGRLVAALGSCGRAMVGLADAGAGGATGKDGEADGDAEMREAVSTEAGDAKGPAGGAPAQAPAPAAKIAAGGKKEGEGAGKKKKKKGGKK